MGLDSNHVKGADGSILWKYWLFLWPYSFGSRLISQLRRALSKEPTWTQVKDGWYIGGWPHSDSVLPDKQCAVLDCTVELPRKVTTSNYLALPMWDTYGFTVEQLKQGAAWAVEQAKSRPVYVHCAYGHGRSCTMLSICLTEAGLFPNPVAAFRHISSLRSRTYINERQKVGVVEWMRHKNIEFPADMNTMPRKQPEEITQSELKKT